MSGIQPFTIDVPEDKIAALKQKLSLTTFPDEIDEAGWKMGPPLAEVKRLVQYWKDGYDWRVAERELNKFSHFTVPIDVDGHSTLNIHYVEAKSGVEGAIPLCFVHGWPGSFLEATKLIPLLNNPAGKGPAFDVVVPSLPGYGFSEGSTKPGFSPEQYAEVCHKLMIKLGHQEYVTQGGDWGFTITRLMAHKYAPKHVKAIHLNNILAFREPQFSSQPLLWLQYKLHSFTEAEKRGMERTKWFVTEGRGYNILQSTKPQTLGYALADSPVALLTWVLDKLHDWTDDFPWTDDEILTWISIYAYSVAGPQSSVRIYYYNQRRPELQADLASRYNGAAPLGVSLFPEDLRVPPVLLSKTLGNVVFEKVHADGGHFGAWERPVELADDLRTMFGRGGGAYKVVRGKSGYSPKGSRL